MGVCNCSKFCCTLLYVHSSIAIILMGKRELVALLKDTYFVIYGIISEFTDKGQFHYLTKLKGPQVGNYLYTTQFLLLRYRSILYHKLPNPFMGPLYCPCREVIIISL